MKQTRVGERNETTSAVRRESLPPPLPVRVRPNNARSSPRELRLTSGLCVVGAGTGSDLVVEDATLSRQHVELRLMPEGVQVRDLGSRNGTFYQGHQIASMILAAGATLRLGHVELSVEFDTLSLEQAAVRDSYGGLIARSAAMRKLFGTLRRLEGSLISILFVGESGTGKELLARAVHESSAVAGGPLVTLNCGALQRELVRSELFGHRRGAFTGATENRTGAFQRAHGGTLFLDEVGELPLDVQPVLLRALQQREVVPVGETQPQEVDVRVLAATHRDLEAMVAEGTFREDLFYRLKVIHIHVPPLRERPEDIEALALEAARRAGVAELPGPVLAQLAAHSWPGNVRELMHAVEAYVAIGELPLLNKRPLRALSALLAEHIDVQVPYEVLKRELTHSFHLAYLRQLMAHAGGNVSRAARLSGIERSYLNKLAIQYGLR